MNDRVIDKTEQILKTAMQLFAVKGASSTSMQEIAELSGMSKGSLYLVFKSKEELEHGVYLYCFRMIRDPLQKEELSTRPPREKLRNQIEILLSHVYELREFLQRQFQELAGKGVTETPDWLRKYNASLMRWFQNRLELIYGTEVLAYTGDISLLGRGMIHSYITVLFNSEFGIPISRLADHLMELIDNTVAALLAGKPAPLISGVMLDQWMARQEGRPHQSPLQLVKRMHIALGAAAGIAAGERELALETLAVLEGELLTLHPRRAVIFGMLHNLREVAPLAGVAEELKQNLAPYMQNHCDEDGTPR